MTPIQTFPSGATRRVSRYRYDLIPPVAVRAEAERFWLGVLTYGDSNWMKGVPFSTLLYHLEEHLQRFKERHVESRTVEPRDGGEPFEYTDGDIENLAAIRWGCAALIHFIATGRTDLDDRPYKPRDVEVTWDNADHTAESEFCPLARVTPHTKK